MSSVFIIIDEVGSAFEEKDEQEELSTDLLPVKDHCLRPDFNEGHSLSTHPFLTVAQ